MEELKRKKIIHIEDFFHPDAGYQVNILAKYMAAEGYEVFILTAEPDKLPKYLTDFFGRDNIMDGDKRYSDKYGVSIIRVPLRAYISGRAIYDKKIWRTIRELQPDILFVHGCDTYIGMQVLKNAHRLPYKIVSDNHMVDMASKNPLRSLFRIYYKKVIASRIIKEHIPVLRMVADNYVEKRLGIPLKQAPLIPFGSDTMLFHPNTDVREAFRKKYNLKNNTFVFCYAGKLDEYKGGIFLGQVLLEKFSVNKEIAFIIVGNVSGEYGEKVEELFRKSQNHILRFPTQKYEDLAEFYQAADAAFFPHACSLSFFDVQACGLPVISEKMDINEERCSHENGLNFEIGNVEECRKQICTLVNMNNEKFSQMKNNAVDFIYENYNYKNILKQYLSFFESDFNK